MTDAENISLDSLDERLSRDTNELIVEPITTKPDDFGRTRFVLHWHGYHPFTGYGHRCQVFSSVLGEHLEIARAAGRTVIVLTVGQETSS